MKTFFITGAEGVGKTSILKLLNAKLPKANFDIHDFDELGVPLENLSLQWRLDATYHWIDKAIKNQKKNLNTIIVGLSLPSEVGDIKESTMLREIIFCLLDVSEKEREKRLIKRGALQEVILDLEQHASLRKEVGKTNYKKTIIDTTNLSIAETAEKVIKFILNEK